MEATGVYWRPVFWVLERRFECWLLNAQHLHNVPGRKSDLIDSAWCCQLLEHGLVRPSFVPPPEIRRLRDLTRLRSTQMEERSRAIQRLEKVLQDAGIKFSSVASKTYSVSARAMLEALLGGVSDPIVLAELAKGKLRAKIPQLQEALANRFELAHHGVLVAAPRPHRRARRDGRQPRRPHQRGHRPVRRADRAASHHPRRRPLHRRGADRRVRRRHDRLPQRRTPRLLGGHLPRHQPVRRQAPLRQDPPRRPLAAHRTQRSRPRRRAHQADPPRLPRLADPRPPRRAESDRRHPPPHPDRLPPHRPRPSALPRTLARPARPPPPRRAPHPPPRQTTRSTRQQGHPPGRRPNTRPDDVRTTPPPNPPSNPLTRGPIRPSTPPAFTP